MIKRDSIHFTVPLSADKAPKWQGKEGRRALRSSGPRAHGLPRALTAASDRLLPRRECALKFQSQSFPGNFSQTKTGATKCKQDIEDFFKKKICQNLRDKEMSQALQAHPYHPAQLRSGERRAPGSPPLYNLYVCTPMHTGSVSQGLCWAFVYPFKKRQQYGSRIHLQC